MSEPVESQEEILNFLADPRTHRLATPVPRIDTANAVVFLAGPDVYKVKRAVAYPYMDFSTVEKRREACEAEIAVNRDNAPSIYLDALPIVRKGASLAIGGGGEVVEWVVHLRRFDEKETLDLVVERGGLSDAIIDKLAATIRRSHARAPLRDATRAAAELELYIAQNEAAFAAWPDLFPPATARRLGEDCRAAFAIARPTLLARGEGGQVRRGHGDLHLRNIVLIGGEPTLFDAVEFSDAIASGDVLYDLAFLLMDLEERGQRRAANRIFNRYLAGQPPQALAGLAALPLFLSLRAAIRAKVEATAAERLAGAERRRAQDLARRYFDRAVGFLREASSRLVAVGGLSGTGKSALSAALAPWIGRTPGALWLRSDVERKAMFGIEETERLPDAAYSAEVSARVYRRVDDSARRALKAGHSVVLDATFASARDRLAAARAAYETGAAFHGLFLVAPLDVRLARVAGRGADASDADERVARAQRADPLAQRGWTELDASGGVDKVAEAAARRLGVELGVPQS